jgi:urea carboxylase
VGARHVEVQIFGDGLGNVVSIGDRDCSLQRRNQKVCEEAPAPDLSDEIRESMAKAARDLCASVSYRSAGTVEYIYDPVRKEAAFLEVNTRLQVEHPVTESIFDIDLVAWMLRLAQGETEIVNTPLESKGFAVEARIYAENTDLGNLPSSGTITRSEYPSDVRVDTWIEAGSEVSNFYDPMLAKVISVAQTRDEAWSKLETALVSCRVDGIATNLGMLRSIAGDATVRAAKHSTATLATIENNSPRVEVVKAGMLATIQDYPGRTGYWSVGIPPSGPMDDLSFRLANEALGNQKDAAGIEVTMAGPTLKFHTDTTICLTGAPTPLKVNGSLANQWIPIPVTAGSIVEIGSPSVGMRSYLAIAGGLDVPIIMGSASTFDLGEIGGASGRALRTGDVINLFSEAKTGLAHEIPEESRPTFTSAWRIGALEGPHAAPEFFTENDIEVFYRTDWEVHFNSARTGVRLVGPKPEWARQDGGEAGLHPSNIHDTPYAIGAVDYTGDLPILLGPDGPSLGGFTCPATVATGQLWKLGQLRPGDTVRFVPISELQADELRTAPTTTPEPDRLANSDGGVLLRIPANEFSPEVTYRRSGDANLLVEYGAMVLDLASRMRVHALATEIEDLRAKSVLTGVVDLTPGIRSLQIHIDPAVINTSRLIEIVRDVESKLPATKDLKVPSRTVSLPLSWDDPSTREAIERYMNGVRDDAPWCPWNIEFIRRINGLPDVDDVLRTVFEAEYLVLGLGDVYLGAPVATPVDPRHRLVTTKYNPARTWTPQNAVGIGGAYMCIYGMEGPGGYQFVGRTIQIWSTLRQGKSFENGVPWLLRFFDRIRWYPVTADELLVMRAEMAAGRLEIPIEQGEFSMAEYQAFLDENAASIDEFKAMQGAAFANERSDWQAAGEFDRQDSVEAPVASATVVIPEGSEGIEAPFNANVFRVDVKLGDTVTEGQTLVAVEAMKMEAQIVSTTSGTVTDILVKPGDTVSPATVLVIIERNK